MAIKVPELEMDDPWFWWGMELWSESMDEDILESSQLRAADYDLWIRIYLDEELELP